MNTRGAALLVFAYDTDEPIDMSVLERGVSRTVRVAQADLRRCADEERSCMQAAASLVSAPRERWYLCWLARVRINILYICDGDKFSRHELKT